MLKSQNINCILASYIMQDVLSCPVCKTLLFKAESFFWSHSSCLSRVVLDSVSRYPTTRAFYPTGGTSHTAGLSTVFCLPCCWIIVLHYLIPADWNIWSPGWRQWTLGFVHIIRIIPLKLIANKKYHTINKDIGN